MGHRYYINDSILLAHGGSRDPGLQCARPLVYQAGFAVTWASRPIVRVAILFRKDSFDRASRDFSSSGDSGEKSDTLRQHR